MYPLKVTGTEETILGDAILPFLIGYPTRQSSAVYFPLVKIYADALLEVNFFGCSHNCFSPPLGPAKQGNRLTFPRTC